MEREALLDPLKANGVHHDLLFSPITPMNPPHPREGDLEALEYGTVLQSQFRFWVSASPRIIRMIFTTTLRGLHGLTPSFVSSKPQDSKQKLHPTAYLDGIRGLASLFVCCFHLSYTLFDNVHGFGWNNSMYSPLRLPFIRLFWGAGHAMVGIFFVVSGYSLSIKPVRTMRRHDWLEFRRTLSSSAFRRPFRLYVPCIASTGLIFILIRLGVFDITRDLAFDAKFLSMREYHPDRLESFWAQVEEWVYNFYYFLNVWADNPRGAHPPYDHHLWSISSEMRCSMNLFIAQIALAGLKPKYRMMALLVMIIWCMAVFFYGPTLFYSGFLLAELHHYRGRSLETFYESLPRFVQRWITRYTGYSRSDPLSKEMPKTRSFGWELFYGANFVMALYLCSCPFKDIIDTPGWWIFGYLIPPSYAGSPGRFWPTIGAIQLVWSTSCSPAIQRIFDNSVSQYFGKISFMIYILHYVVIHTIGYMLMKFFWGFTGYETDFQKQLGWFMAASITMVYVIWAGDIFARYVDGPSVRFARWIEEKLVGKTPPDP